MKNSIGVKTPLVYLSFNYFFLANILTILNGHKFS